MILNDFEQLGDDIVLTQIYGSLPDIGAIPENEKTAMLNRIVNILERGYHKYDSCDKAMIQNEEIVKAILGIDHSVEGAPLPYVKLREILNTPMQELLRQMDRVPSTLVNMNALRTVFALMINGETDEMVESLSKSFPQYFRQMQNW